MNKFEVWEKIIQNKKNKKLIFVHTPKCGGSYASKILSDLDIENKGHNQAIKREGIHFTIIREPVERFQSLMNYRLSEPKPRNDWPRHLDYVYSNKNIELNIIISKMTDAEILGFSPYKTLVHWSKDVDIIITIDELHDLLSFFGYNYDENKYKPENVSKKVRGIFDAKTRERIENLYNKDMLLFNRVLSINFNSRKE
jgi:hypothetical protein